MKKYTFIFAVLMTLSLVAEAKIVTKLGKGSASCSQTAYGDNCPFFAKIELGNTAEDNAKDDGKEKCEQLDGRILNSSISDSSCNKKENAYGIFINCSASAEVECEIAD